MGRINDAIMAMAEWTHNNPQLSKALLATLGSNLALIAGIGVTSLSVIFLPVEGVNATGKPMLKFRLVLFSGRRSSPKYALCSERTKYGMSCIIVLLRDVNSQRPLLLAVTSPEAWTSGSSNHAGLGWLPSLV